MCGAVTRIPAIPEVYRGVRFRSRLEADWARSLDEHGIEWAYEPQGFRLGAHLYLPDLWLPDLRTIVEVKGLLDTTSRTKVMLLAVHAASVGVHVVLAEAPAGERWSTVEADGEIVLRRYGLARCPGCGAWQFPVGRCAHISHGARRATPLAQRFAFWASELRRLGRTNDAAVCDGERLRLEIEGA